MNIDPNTNLPALPEGYFWRVRGGGSWLHLELRRKRLIGSVELYDRSVSTYGFPPGGGGNEYRRFTESEIRQEIQRKAESVIRQWGEDLQNSVTANELVGDYPPKRLG